MELMRVLELFGFGRLGIGVLLIRELEIFGFGCLRLGVLLMLMLGWLERGARVDRGSALGRALGRALGPMNVRGGRSSSSSTSSSLLGALVLPESLCEIRPFGCVSKGMIFVEGWLISVKTQSESRRVRKVNSLIAKGLLTEEDMRK